MAAPDESAAGGSYDDIKIGLTATPALHTSQIFGPAVFTYSYREAVIDGWLVDHELPYVIQTKRQQEGITFKKGQEVSVYLPKKNTVDTWSVPDDTTFDVKAFNTKVITTAFNQAVCQGIVENIDPYEDAKTLIFCLNNAHADMVVRLLREEYRKNDPEFDEDLIIKITGAPATDKPLEKIKRFRNERDPNIVVTVDLLTTGVDVPKITNLVFIRRVRSRILYEQMLGRATRLCDEIGKTMFRIYDAVGIYESLEEITDMKPVVAHPSLSFQTLAAELQTQSDPEVQAVIHEQLLAKLHRVTAQLSQDAQAAFEELTGQSVEEVLEALRSGTTAAAKDWVEANTAALGWLDRPSERADEDRIPIDPGTGEYRQTIQALPDGKDPGDYLESFEAYLKDNPNEIPALLVVTQRPRDLTRQQLRALTLHLEGAGFKEAALRAAWAKKTNQDLAATIIGHIRKHALGDPLKPYDRRVEEALQRILAKRAWTRPQKDWLRKLANQLKANEVIDHTTLNTAPVFKRGGGFNRLNRTFNGNLDAVLGDLKDAIWA